MPVFRPLLRGVVDYAGLFPPAALAMTSAVRNYAAYQAGATCWMLGRFVVPADRLDELARAAAALPADAGAPRWRLSALVGSDAGAALTFIDTFNARHAARAADSGGRPTFVVDAVEAKAGDLATLDNLAREVASHAASGAAYAREVYVEVPLDPDPAPLAARARAAWLRLKARTGGVTASAFPPAAWVARFLARAAEHDVPCKATAGLHHALRGEYALTYEPGCARGAMFGFLNVLLAATFLRAGAAPADVVPLLEERDAASLGFGDADVTWRGPRGTLRADAAAVADARARGVVSFGSCSFDEPAAELGALGLL